MDSDITEKTIRVEIILDAYIKRPLHWSSFSSCLSVWCDVTCMYMYVHHSDWLAVSLLTPLLSIVWEDGQWTVETAWDGFQQYIIDTYTHRLWVTWQLHLKAIRIRAADQLVDSSKQQAGKPDQISDDDQLLLMNIHHHHSHIRHDTVVWLGLNI